MPGQVYRHDAPEAPPIVQDLSFEKIAPDLLMRLATLRDNGPRTHEALDEELRGYEYRIGPRDVLTFTVWDHPELSLPTGELRDAELQGHLVSARGEVFFPFVGDVDVAGRTVEEVRREVTERLSVFVQEPQLDVRVAAFRSKKVHVMGQVGKPGVQTLTDSPLTLVEALTNAGGATPEAALQRVQVVRDGSVSTFDVHRLLEHGDLRQNLLLRNGDVVYVPDNSFFSVHVLGEVHSPGMIPMPSGRLNLAEAISLSGGFDADRARPERVFVFRGDYAEPDVFWLDARSADAMLLATQFEMQAQDVVFVAARDLARFNRAIGLILPAVQTLWQTQSFIDRLRD